MTIPSPNSEAQRARERAASTPMRILHFADVHLDRPFVDMALDDARERRRELRSAFDRCVELAVSGGVDLITIGGDLWEDEHVTPDTVRWVASRLAGAGIPVVMVAGNHDPLSSGGPYVRASFADNVRVLSPGPDLSSVEFGDLVVWGMSWERGRPLVADSLTRFRVPDDGRAHVLLLHGTCGAYFEAGAHCPFSIEHVRAAGFTRCLAGHIHAASDPDDLVLYPGSPEPLAWSQDGRHTVVLLDLNEGSAPSFRAELVDVNRRRFETLEVECTGSGSSADLERRVLEAVGAVGVTDGLGVRVQLRGRIDAHCAVDTDALARTVLSLGGSSCEVHDRTRPAFDLDTIEASGGVAAEFTRRLRARIELASEGERASLELALDLGLRALEGDQL